ncbi:histidine kinase [Fulvivirgaceae bacterium BMA12]|uniref:Histidine kinase n=1 Tax=Agaribacillus aureus TaxID=3051825 RepID=A0ABT8L7L4_9BACT|nr:histidine kinase [Fulvivirgaceae bacterium BMA12]
MRKIGGHIVFWLLYISFTVAIYYVKEPSFLLHLTYELASLPAKLFIVYFTLYFILPKYLLNKKYGLATMLFLVVLVMAVLLLQLSVSVIVYPIYYSEVAITFVPNNLEKLVSPLLDLIIVSSLAVVIKLLRDRELQERSRLQLEKMNVQNKLQLLKSQLHPHFLFNTLNGLYACTLENPLEASKIVIRLSDLLRFIIYEGDQPLVPLKDELDALENYVELEKIRYGEKMQAKWTVTGEAGNKKIVPLLMLPFVENAFKHGPAKISSNSWVSCDIGIEDRYLVMKLGNSKTGDELPKIRHGIGLNNVQQRLKHNYEGKYELTIDDQPKQFLVFLKIPLKVL